jgi:hypothetical protein
MEPRIKVCFDRVLPRDLYRPPVTRGGNRTRAALPFRKRWPVGSTLRVRFLEGSAEQHDTVKRFAPQWTEYANLRLEFDDSPDAEIRVAFQDDGAWSYMGTDCADIPRDQPTMNYGWLDEAVVLHEFGHAVGLIHEHQNPVGGIQWNKPVVYRDLAGPPNFWDQATVDNNLFKKYELDQLNATQFDPQSIMLYSFPATWTLNSFSAGENNVLSDIDKEFIAGSGGYPRPDGPSAGPAEIDIDGPAVEADIGAPGEEDLFTFRVQELSRFAVQTRGSTDVVLTLYGPDSPTKLLARDDDSGYGFNARVVEDLAPGTYHVQVRHYNLDGGTGKYGVKVTKVA